MSNYLGDEFKNREMEIIKRLQKGHSISSIAGYFGVMNDYVKNIADRELEK